MDCILTNISKTKHQVVNSKEQTIRIRTASEAQTCKSSELDHQNMNSSKDLNNCNHSNQWIISCMAVAQIRNKFYLK